MSESRFPSEDGAAQGRRILEKRAEAEIHEISGWLVRKICDGNLLLNLNGKALLLAFALNEARRERLSSIFHGKLFVFSYSH